MKHPQTQKLLGAGLIAGPLVLSVEFPMALLREGFDMQRNAASQLALGDIGWIQSLNFIVAGVLMLAFTLGVRRHLAGKPGGVWIPILLGLFAISHVGVGVFPTDPGFGFPPGPDTPAGIPDYATATLHAKLHSVFGGLGFNMLAAASFVLAWRFGSAQRLWQLLSLFNACVILGISVYAASWEAMHQGPERASAMFNFLPMWATLPVVWGYLTALAWKLRSESLV